MIYRDVMPVDRRRAIELLATGVGVAAAGFNFGCGEGGAYTRQSFYRPTPEAPLTPTEQFYVYHCCGEPEPPPPDRWRLHLRGLVERETALSLADLESLPLVTREITLECVGNSPAGTLISSAAFEGPALRDVLALAGLSPRARALHLAGLDGYGAYLPRAVLDDDAAMVVLRMNGEPLPPLHGAPARALFPDRYGMFSVKWLDAIVGIRRYAPFGALRGLGHSVDGIKEPRSRVDAPRDGGTVYVGEATTLRGLAVTAGVGVERVEVEVDGEWQPAALTFNTLTDERSPYLWSLWSHPWTPKTVGQHVIRVRAFAADGSAQGERSGFPYDGGAVHAVRVAVIARD